MRLQVNAAMENPNERVLLGDMQVIVGCRWHRFPHMVLWRSQELVCRMAGARVRSFLRIAIDP